MPQIGKLVRKLDIGHQQVGLYQNRSQAAYWDGKNTLGETVASGVYFYTLTADDFTATRRMLILKQFHSSGKLEGCILDVLSGFLNLSEPGFRIIGFSR